MKTSQNLSNPTFYGWLITLILNLTIVLVSNISYAGIASSPLFLTTSIAPIVMLNVSKDHQLYFKAFDDFSDLDNDNLPETTYKHSLDYYGYFDSHKCYIYSTANNQFEPSTITSTKYCTSSWSGNFLNWASMTRIDAIRKILYGGLRSTDNASGTVLERSYLPNDAHSFAKFYSGSDLTQLTPFTSSEVSTGITLCNTTVSATTLSQNVTDAPLIRVAKGNYSLWAANERWQCRWSEEKTNGNSNSSSVSGISAQSSSPSKATNGLGSKDYIARIKVCDSSYVGKENCKGYPDGTIKPIGLLQIYGDNNSISFGLMTGSYGKNKSGGVLRKNASSMNDEINVTTNGTFKPAPSTGGIINTLNKLRIYGYRHSDGTYFSDQNLSDINNCPWTLSTFANGTCSNWGNPQSEIFLESLRYLTNHSGLSAYLPTSPTDSSYISGLTVATATDPITQYCAKLNIIQFNASTSSYDGDELGNVTDIGASAINPLTNDVGSGEDIPGHDFFIGENGTNNNQLCTAKTVTNLSDVRGTCPDAPRLSGSYHIAGLAHYSHLNDMRPDLTDDQFVTTYGVALSPALPKIVVPVPGSTTQKVTILPACQDTSLKPTGSNTGNCALVDFKIVHQDCSLLSPVPSGTWNCGKVYVNWEDSEQGGDYDQDAWGVLSYSVSSTEVKITTDVVAQSTPFKLAFGYILSGTTKDGFHAHSGINSYTYTDPQGTTSCTNCVFSEGASTVTYTIGSSSASSLQQPLYYAAKWGGFIDKNGNGIPDQQDEWDKNNDAIPDNYFFATNPNELATSLGTAFANVAAANSSASAVAANSTRLDSGSKIYQAKFNSTDWSGELLAFSVNVNNGSLSPDWNAAELLPSPDNRNIYTYNPSAAQGFRGVQFLWNNLTTTPVGSSQVDYLNTLLGNNDGNGSLRLDWLRGDNSNEENGHDGIFRKRTNLLGDIVNSDPIFVGTQDYGYSGLSGSEGSQYKIFRASSTYKTRRPMIYVGANDGMFHGFDANSTASSGKEIFAYIPNALFPELSKLTSPNYAHQYYVDGSSAVNDVYFNSAWHTVLVGTTGAGGRAVFGLDVTNPDNFGTSSALWEFTNNDTTYGDDLGYTLAQPTIARTEDGHWVVIVSNGYNSNNGHAVLFVLDAQTGAVLQKIDTGVGNTTNKNGLSSPIAVDTNNNLSVDTVYAGDLYGNLWKFNISGSAGSWPVPSVPFFVACTDNAGSSCSSDNRQPITAKPNVGKVNGTGTDQNGVGLMVFFGTGKYFETSDNNVSGSPQIQSFYGLWDQGSAVSDRSLLQEQTISFEGTATTESGVSTIHPIRIISKNPVCYAPTSKNCSTIDPLKSGWFVDLKSPNNGAEGERVVSFPLVRRGLVVFASVIPSADPCSAGGRSWLMELDAQNGSEFTGAPFDTNGDGNVDDGDKVNGHYVAGIDLGIGIIKTPAVVEASKVDYKYASGSTGKVDKAIDFGVGTGGGGGNANGYRKSWQQLK